MISHQLRQKREHLNRNSGQGFTLIEVVVAGVILVSVMTAVAQMSVSSLGSAENRETRDDLEAAVNNDIQLLQQAGRPRLTQRHQRGRSIDPYSAFEVSQACLRRWLLPASLLVLLSACTMIKEWIDSGCVCVVSGFDGQSSGR